MLIIYLYFLNHLNLFTHFANICPEHNINCTVVHENIGSLSFLEVKLCGKNAKFVTSIYRKPNFKTFYLEINHLRIILRKNNYPPNLFYLCIESFLNKLYTPKIIVQNVLKTDVFVKLSFSGSTLFQSQKNPQKLFTDESKTYNLKIVFMSPVRVKRFFNFKVKLPKMLLL